MSVLEVILLLGGVSGAIFSIWTLISRVINPIKTMLTDYRSALCDAQKQIAEISILNKTQSEQLSESLVDRQRINGAVKDILSFILMTECARGITKSNRSLGKTKDLDRIHTRYRQYGLNGAGEDLWNRYLRIPLDTEPAETERQKQKIKEYENEYRNDYSTANNCFGDQCFDPAPRSLRADSSSELDLESN